MTADFDAADKVFGLGLFSPFGIGGRKWPESGLTRYFSTESQIGTVVVNPSMVWRVDPRVSIGVGIDYLTAFGSTERMVNQSFVGAGDAKSSFDTTGDGWGYNLGLLIFPDEPFSMGLAYLSHIETDMEGTLVVDGIAPMLQPSFGGRRFESDVTNDLTFPTSLAWDWPGVHAPTWT